MKKRLLFIVVAISSFMGVTHTDWLSDVKDKASEWGTSASDMVKTATDKVVGASKSLSNQSESSISSIKDKIAEFRAKLKDNPELANAKAEAQQEINNEFNTLKGELKNLPKETQDKLAKTVDRIQHSDADLKTKIRMWVDSIEQVVKDPSTPENLKTQLTVGLDKLGNIRDNLASGIKNWVTSIRESFANTSTKSS